MECCSDQFLEFHPVHGTNLQLDYTGTQATRVESFANGLCFSKLPLKPGEIFLIEIEEKELGWCGHLRVGLTAHDPAGLEVVPEYSLPDMMELGDSWIFAITRNHNKVPKQVAADGEGGEADGEGGEADGERREGGRRLGRRPGEEEEEALDRARREETSSKPQRFFTDSHLHIGDFRIPRDKLVGRSRPGRFSHILDDLYKSHALPPTARRSRIGVLYVPGGQGRADMHIVINGEDMGASARGIPAHWPLYAVVDVFASTKCVRIVQVEYGCKCVIMQVEAVSVSSCRWSTSCSLPAVYLQPTRCLPAVYLQPTCSLPAVYRGARWLSGRGVASQPEGPGFDSRLGQGGLSRQKRAFLCGECSPRAPWGSSIYNPPLKNNAEDPSSDDYNPSWSPDAAQAGCPLLLACPPEEGQAWMG